MESLPWKKENSKISKINEFEKEEEEDINIGVCFGFEVLSSDAYRIETKSDGSTKLLTNIKESSEKKDEVVETKEAIARTKEEEEKRVSKKEKKKLKKKLKKQRAKEKVKLDKETSSNIEPKPQPKTSLEIIEQNWSKECKGIQIHETLLKGLQELDYKFPTPIQKETLPPALFGKRNMIGAAPTGSGKTLSFGIPILDGMLRDSSKVGLILAPTRELAMQIETELSRVCVREIQMSCLVGGFTQVKQEKILNKKGAKLIIGTPGRTWDLMQSGEYEVLNQFRSKIDYLVIDEVDRMMVNTTVFPQLQSILDYIPNKVQTFVFSATLALNSSLNQTSESSFIDTIIDRIGMVEPIKSIDLTSTSTSEISKSTCIPSSITLYQINCTVKHKDSHTYAILSTYLKTPGPTIIFCNSIPCVKRVAATLSLLLGPDKVKALHGKMIQKTRCKALESLDDQTVLIATDVAARGIDIPSIQTIIHYDVAHNLDTFLHRTGRTARGVFTNSNFTCISIVSPGKEEARFEKYAIEMKELKLNQALLKAAQTRTALACQIYKYEHEVSQERNDINWIQKLSREADIELDSEEEEEEEDQRRQDGLIRRKKLELKQLLEEPMTEQRFGKFSFSLQNSIRLLKDEDKKRKREEIHENTSSKRISS